MIVFGLDVGDSINEKSFDLDVGKLEVVTESFKIML